MRRGGHSALPPSMRLDTQVVLRAVARALLLAWEERPRSPAEALPVSMPGSALDRAACSAKSSRRWSTQADDELSVVDCADERDRVDGGGRDHRRASDRCAAA